MYIQNKSCNYFVFSFAFLAPMGFVFFALLVFFPPSLFAAASNSSSVGSDACTLCWPPYLACRVSARLLKFFAALLLHWLLVKRHAKYGSQWPKIAKCRNYDPCPWSPFSPCTGSRGICLRWFTWLLRQATPHFLYWLSASSWVLLVDWKAWAF